MGLEVVAMRFVRWFVIGAGVAVGIAVMYRLVTKGHKEDYAVSAELDEAKVA